MSVKCHLILNAVEQFAPPRLAESWDAVGLQVGSPQQDIDCVMVALDVSEITVAEAIAHKAGLIIAHHPFLFKPLDAVRTDRTQGRLLRSLLTHDIAVFAAHTNLDIAPGGVNDILAGRLQLKRVEILRATAVERLIKLVVFVPATHVEQVREAIAGAGAGHIGNYSHCAFQTAGTGSFLPLAGSNPYLGNQGKLEYAQEYRLETIMPEKIQKQVVAAMLEAHPYEEVAYDLYLLHNQGDNYGLGRIGELSGKMELGDFAASVKQALGAATVRVCGHLSKPVSRIAVCGGSGFSLLHAAAQAGADVLVTGDVKYHEAQEALASGIALIDAGHFNTEAPVVQVLADYLRSFAVQQNWNLRVIANTGQQDIFQSF